jgi:hypothetical protein
VEDDHAISVTKKAISPGNALMLMPVVAVAVVDLEVDVVAVVVAHATNATSLDILLVNALKKVKVATIVINHILALLAAVTIVEILIIFLVIVINQETWIMLSAIIAKALVICPEIAPKLLKSW